MKLDRYATPGRLPEPTEAGAQAWSDRVGAIVASYAERLPRFFDATQTELDDVEPAPVGWAAFPARLRNSATSEAQRWRDADASRDEQDEYCEWTVERNRGKIVRITFTSEVPEYFHHVAEQDQQRLLALYHELVSTDVELSDLLFDDGSYNPDNSWNTSTEGRPAHLRQDSNKLEAAIDLAARATVPRERDGLAVSGKQALVICSKLGNEERNSDPQVAAAVNAAAATGARVGLADPLGLYIDQLRTDGMQTPDRSDPGDYWKVERGEAGLAVRARFEVPEGADFAVGDILLNGRPIEFGAQLADRVQVRITAAVKPAELEIERAACEA